MKSPTVEVLLTVTSPNKPYQELRHGTHCRDQKDHPRHQSIRYAFEGERALNKFLGEYDWDEQQLNLDRLEELLQHTETLWSKDGFVVTDDPFTEKNGDTIPNVGRFYDHAEGDYIWGENLVYSYYTDDKTGYPLSFRLYQIDGESKIE